MSKLIVFIVIFALGIVAGLYFSERQNAPAGETTGQTIGRLIDRAATKLGAQVGSATQEAGTKATSWLGQQIEQLQKQDSSSSAEEVTPPEPVQPVENY